MFAKNTSLPRSTSSLY